jgi:hypothetical protein
MSRKKVVTAATTTIDEEFKESFQTALEGAMGHDNESYLRKYLEGVLKKIKTYDPSDASYVDYARREADRNRPPQRFGVPVGKKPTETTKETVEPKVEPPTSGEWISPKKVQKPAAKRARK